MFSKYDPELLAKFTADPASLLATLHDFQTATLAAAQEIAENNVAAFQELATKASTNPQESAQVQPALLQATYEKNMEVLTSLWKSLGANAATTKKPGKAK